VGQNQDNHSGNKTLLERADLLMLKGYVQYLDNQFTPALQSWQKSLEIYQKLGKRQAEGAALSNLGLVYEARGNYLKAIKNYKKSLLIAQEIEDRKGQGYVFLNLGNVYCNLGQYNPALNLYQQGLEIAQELPEISLDVSVFNNLGNIYQILGDLNRAIDFFYKGLRKAQVIKNYQIEANIYGNLGWVHYLQGEYDLAIDNYKQSLKIKREIGDSRGEVHTISRLGLLYGDLGELDRAIEHHQRGLAISREIEYATGELDTLKNLGEAYLISGNLQEAQQNLYNAIKLGEFLRLQLSELEETKVTFFETQDLTYRILQKVLIFQNKIQEALEISERGRSRELVELLSGKLRETTESGFLVAHTSIEQIIKIAKQQCATIVEYSIIYDKFRVEKKLQIKESELFIWVIQPTGVVNFRKVNLKSLWQEDKTTLADLVAMTRESIGVRGRDAVRVRKMTSKDIDNQRLKQLYDKLIQPIADCLPQNENEKVIFIPHESLFLVPFPALQDTRGNYLIEQHTILTVPSIEILNLTRQRCQQVKIAAKKEVVVVGNPKMPKVFVDIGQPLEQLRPLPGAKREAEIIAEILNTTAITGDIATKISILPKLFEARIIHFATHGILNYSEGLDVPGAIALAPSESDDGVLSAVEILNLKLNAELVVLSACDTGKGLLTGDGVTGLSRSLIVAGVPSIIVTLWAVPDNPTADLMAIFYQNLSKGLDKAQALRQAMLTIMKQHPNSPKTWAAFTLIGEAT
jgi:CHAT domain-containing protein/Tfp pilus assembly protein PilF